MMIRALWTGATGMQAQQFNIDTISNDLANVNTYGYKKRRVNFHDLFYQSLRASGIQGANTGNNTPVGLQVGHGVRASGTTPVFTQGGALETGIWSDMRIVDPGGVAQNFFGVTLPDGMRAYTRDGSFRINDQGELTTVDGLSMDPPITGLPANALDPTVTESGQVQYKDAAGNLVQLARVGLYQFVNPAGLEPIGDNRWKETPASGAATAGNPEDPGFGKIQGSWVEASNVDAITEMVNMIAAQRAYEFNSRSIQASDDMLQTVNTLKR